MMTIGTVARKTGLTVRTLHHWEDIGLIKPVRSESGQRHYGVRDLVSITQIKQLKAANLRLEDIAALMEGTSDALQVLSTQMALLESQKHEITTAVQGLKEAIHTLEAGHAPSLAHLCTAIKWGQSHMSEDKWQAVYDAYYTKDEQAEWANAKLSWAADMGPDGIKNTEQKWAHLIARIEDLIQQGAQPTDASARACAGEWAALTGEFIERNPALAAGVGRMYDDLENWDAKTGGNAPEPPFSPEVWNFVQEASKTT